MPLVHTYRAPSLQDALELVRRELGPDAAVLQTRSLSGWRQWLGEPAQIEVTAALGVETPSRFAVPAAVPRGPAPRASAPERDLGAALRSRWRADLAAQFAGAGLSLEDLRPQSASAPAHPPETNAFLASLRRLGWEEADVRWLGERLHAAGPGSAGQEPWALRARAAGLLAEEIEVWGPVRLAPGRRCVAALVGPAGSGKTSTLVKLAARFAARDGRRVGLLALGAPRVGGWEQLRANAQVLGLPLECAAAPGQVRGALRRLESAELVLAETPGAGPHDLERGRELSELLAAAAPDEIHLVLSAAASPACLAEASARFRRLGGQALVLTKCDEAAALGGVVPLLRRDRWPVSYLADGEGSPEELRLADPLSLARRLLREAD